MESDSNSPDGQVLYQIICLWDTPPFTDEEQQRCLHAVNGCWRANHPSRQQGRRNGKQAPVGATKAERNGHDSEEEDCGDQGERSNGHSRVSHKKKEAQEATE